MTFAWAIGSIFERAKTMKAIKRVRVHLFVGILSCMASSVPCAQEQRSEVDRQLGPLVLLRELSEGSIQTLLAEAEGQYRFGQLTQAMAGFRGLLELAPKESRAWLRLGNLHHQAGATDAALVAYQRVIDLPAASEVLELIRDKALFNLGFIHLERAEKALGLLEASTNAREPRQFDALTALEKEALDTQLELREVIIETKKRADLNAESILLRSKKSRTQASLRKP
jgi:tetratricopeptide (TPR) repeat protein